MATRGRRVGLVFIVLAIVLVIIVGVAAFMFKDQIFPALGPAVALPTSEAPAVKTVDIVVLTQSISFGQIIPDAAIGFAPIPVDKDVAGLYFKTKDQVKGKRARYQLQNGTILTTGMLSEGSVGSYASSQIPAGYVAISIPISQLTSVSYAIQPGDHVSVIVALLLDELDPNFQTILPNFTGKVEPPGQKTTTDKGTSGGSATIGITSGGPSSVQGRTEMDPILNSPVYVQPSEAQRPRVVTQVLVADAMILGVGKFPLAGGPPESAVQQPTPQAGAATPTPGPVATEPKVVTLVVTPQDAVTINYILLNRGAMFNLVLRSALDTKTSKTEAVTLQFLMDQYNIPFPSKLPYGLEPRVDTLSYPDPNK